MKKIEAIIRPGKLEEVKEALSIVGIRGMTISQVMGCGRQKGTREVYLGAGIELHVLPKTKLEIVVDDAMVNPVIEAIMEAAPIGEIGDGKIFVFAIEEAIRIRTGERGIRAI